MNKLIAFLEACGHDAGLAAFDTEHLRNEGLQAGLGTADLDALLSREPCKIGLRLAASPRLTCLVFPAKDEPGQEEQPDQPEEPKEPSENRLAA